MTNGNGNGSARLSVWLTGAGLAFVLLASLFTLFYTANSAASEAGALKDRVDRLEIVASDNRAELASVCAALVEIETQFRASDQIRNLMHKADINDISMLWSRSYKQEFPTADTYLPTIAQEQPTPCK